MVGRGWWRSEFRTVQYGGAGLLLVLSQTHTAFREGGEKGKAVSAGAVGPLVVRSVDGGRRSYLPVVVSPGGRPGGWRAGYWAVG
jgi:hypothetical protein